jgi:hypothetical protein
VGAGLALPDGVLGRDSGVPLVVFTPKLLVVEPTDNLDGRLGVDVVGVILRVGAGMRVDGESPSAALSNDKLEPCRETGLEPARLAGRELGLELPREPPGVKLVVVLGEEVKLCISIRAC